MHPRRQAPACKLLPVRLHTATRMMLASRRMRGTAAAQRLAGYPARASAEGGRGRPGLPPEGLHSAAASAAACRRAPMTPESSSPTALHAGTAAAASCPVSVAPRPGAAQGSHSPTRMSSSSGGDARPSGHGAPRGCAQAEEGAAWWGKPRHARQQARRCEGSGGGGPAGTTRTHRRWL